MCCRDKSSLSIVPQCGETSRMCPNHCDKLLYGLYSKLSEVWIDIHKSIQNRGHKYLQYFLSFCDYIHVLYRITQVKPRLPGCNKCNAHSFFFFTFPLHFSVSCKAAQRGGSVRGHDKHRTRVGAVKTCMVRTLPGELTSWVLSLMCFSV